MTIPGWKMHSPPCPTGKLGQSFLTTPLAEEEIRMVIENAREEAGKKTHVAISGNPFPAPAAKAIPPQIQTGRENDLGEIKLALSITRSASW